MTCMYPPPHMTREQTLPWPSWFLSGEREYREHINRQIERENVLLSRERIWRRGRRRRISLYSTILCCPRERKCVVVERECVLFSKERLCCCLERECVVVESENWVAA